MIEALDKILVLSENQDQFKQHLVKNKINIKFNEKNNLKYDHNELKSTIKDFSSSKSKSVNIKEDVKNVLEKHNEENENNLADEDWSDSQLSNW